MATDYRYCCDLCGKRTNSYYPNHRRYVLHVEGLKFVVPISTTNFDDLCKDCFTKVVKALGECTEFKEVKLKR